MDGLVSIMQLTSLPAVVGASVFLTWFAKRSLANVPLANCLPVFVYTALIAALLTYIANRITGTLPGNTGVLIADAIINGVLASGIREWIQTSTRPLAESGTAIKAREGTGDGRVTPRGDGAWPLVLFLVPSLALGAAGCAGTIKPPVITPDDQAQVMDLGTKALAGIQVAGEVMKLGQAKTSELYLAGVPGITREVRTSVNVAVIAANEIIQRVITHIDNAVKKVGRLATLTDMRGWITEGVRALVDMARTFERQPDDRIATAGRFIRVALGTVSALVGIDIQAPAAVPMAIEVAR